MTDSDTLHVWYETQLVGKLWKDNQGKIGFQYTSHWVADGFPISQQIPLTIDPYSPTNGVAHKFFVNLLPEGNARHHIIRDLKITDDDFGLLRAIGGECAGALSILPTDHEPSINAQYTPLSDETFHQLLLRKGSIIEISSEENRPRLSLAGAQEKCAIFFDKNQYYLPQKTAPSTHILKFNIRGYSHIPAYECFLAELAKTINLPVVDCQLKTHDKERFLLIKRYDRIMMNDNKIKRLHQEDFCQALGLGHEQKYQQDKGYSFYDCYHLIQQISAEPIRDAENLLKWQIFNFLAGNSDGHAKNLALIYAEKQGITLAPFYDLVCTRAVASIDRRLAFAIGKEFDPDKITLDHWKHLANECHIRELFIRNQLQEIAETLNDQLPLTWKKFEDAYGSYPALQRVQKVVNKQCKRMLKLLT
jgi:serine/threonine-protein kinase HipA